MKLNRLFAHYGPNNDLLKIERKAIDAQGVIFSSQVGAVGFMLISSLITGINVGFLPALGAAFLSAGVGLGVCQLIKKRANVYIDKFESKTSNIELLQLVDTNLVKNIKKEIARTLESGRVIKCESYILAIHAVQQFLIDEEKKYGHSTDLLKHPNISLLMRLNQQKFALQNFINEYKETGTFDFDNLNPVSNFIEKEEHFLLLPKSLVMRTIHLDNLNDLGISESLLTRFNIIKDTPLPALLVSEKPKKTEKIKLTLVDIEEKTVGREVVEDNLFKGVHILIEQIEQEYKSVLTHLQLQNFKNIQNERLPEIFGLYEKIKNLSEREFFEEGLKKALQHIEQELQEIVQECRTGLLKEIKVIEHTSKMRHKAV